METLKLNNKKLIELQKLENQKKLFQVELENQSKIEKFTFDFLNQMVEKDKSPEEIVIARNILLNGIQKINLVNLYDTPTVFQNKPQ